LKTVFPSGVCDWSKPGYEQQEPLGTWIVIDAETGGDETRGKGNGLVRHLMMSAATSAPATSRGVHRQDHPLQQRACVVVQTMTWLSLRPFAFSRRSRIEEE